MALPGDLYIRAPILDLAVHRLALLSGLQDRLLGDQPLRLDDVAAPVEHGLRDLRLGPRGDADLAAWDPVVRFIVTCCEFALESLAQRGGEGTCRLSTAAGSARFVVEWLNAPLRAHVGALASLRARVEQRVRHQLALPAAAHAELDAVVANLAMLAADFGRWYAGGGSTPVISSAGQIDSWSSAVAHVGRISAAVARAATLFDLQTAAEGDR